MTEGVSIWQRVETGLRLRTQVLTSPVGDTWGDFEAQPGEAWSKQLSPLNLGRNGTQMNDNKHTDEAGLAVHLSRASMSLAVHFNCALNPGTAATTLQPFQ